MVQCRFTPRATRAQIQQQGGDTAGARLGMHVAPVRVPVHGVLLWLLLLWMFGIMITIITAAAAAVLEKAVPRQALQFAVTVSVATKQVPRRHGAVHERSDPAILPLLLNVTVAALIVTDLVLFRHEATGTRGARKVEREALAESLQARQIRIRKGAGNVKGAMERAIMIGWCCCGGGSRTRAWVLLLLMIGKDLSHPGAVHHVCFLDGIVVSLSGPY